MKILKIYYDGDCYFCKRYTEFLKLKTFFDRVELISLRKNTEILKKFQSMGLKYNLGMVVEFEDKFYFGDKAFSFLNIQSDSNNILSKLNKFVSQNNLLNKILYNILVIFRYIFLIVQFKTIIFNSKISYNISELIIFRISIFSVILCNLFIFSTYQISNIRFFLILCSTFFLISVFIHLIFFQNLNKKFFTFLNTLSAKSLILYLFCIHFFVHISYLSFPDFVSFRRLVFFIFLIPLLYYFFKQLIKSFKDKKKYVFIFLISIILSTSPGFYIIPYYGGIAGWTEKESIETFTWDEYFIVNNKNEKIVYNHLFLQPNTMNNRFERAFYDSSKKKNPKAENELIQKDYMNFLYQNYLRNYPRIAEGKLPHQIVFGSYSYNGHTLGYYNAKDYQKFSPKNIISIDKVRLHFNQKGELLSSETLYSLKTIN